jgi:hypothetical protein
MHFKLLPLSISITFLFATALTAQPDRWQQEVNYRMQIDFDVNKHQFAGQQQLLYTNHSPDTLHRVFYHLYFNAFQPGSMMDVRSQTIQDPDRRVADRIAGLSKEEIGYLRVSSLTQDGEPVEFETVGTILEVELAEPILPGMKVQLDLDFTGQVPIQIRRSGRDNREGISYSMAQWYPKLAEYDYQGWHANPYVGREFHGVWGNFDVKFTIDKDYIIGATGYLQNPEEVGHGYTDAAVTVPGDKITYHFYAPQVHDFVWSADPDYEHTTFTREDGMTMHFFFQPGDRTSDAWAELPAIMDRAFEFINRTYGQYPYKQYSFLQGGDGGMEYPMATLITGERSLPSLVGVSVHELMHSWYQMVLGSNEALYPWMDEGFTSYASREVMNYLRSEGLLPGNAVEDPHIGGYAGFVGFLQSGLEEPLSTHADHFMTNAAYGVGSYNKGAIILHQLNYIMGNETFDRAMLRYFDEWKFKHPNANDFIRIMEKASGLELDWFREYWVNTTHTVDYGISAVANNEEGFAVVTMEKIGVSPMPLDVQVRLRNGDALEYTIPLRIMRGAKASEGEVTYTVAEDWPWTHPVYELVLPVAEAEVQAIEIDASGRMLDVSRDNNLWENNR